MLYQQMFVQAAEGLQGGSQQISVELSLQSHMHFPRYLISALGQADAFRVNSTRKETAEKVETIVSDYGRQRKRYTRFGNTIGICYRQSCQGVCLMHKN